MTSILSLWAALAIAVHTVPATFANVEGRTGRRTNAGWVGGCSTEAPTSGEKMRAITRRADDNPCRLILSFECLKSVTGS